MIRVKFYGRTQQLAGAGEVLLDTRDPIRLFDLLRIVLKTSEPFPPTEVQAILINGRNCIFLDGLDTLVRDEDLIELLPMVTGG